MLWLCGLGQKQARLYKWYLNKEGRGDGETSEDGREMRSGAERGGIAVPMAVVVVRFEGRTVLGLVRH